MPTWRPIDHQALRRELAVRCFICGLVSGDPEFTHRIVYQDDATIAFLSKYPTVPGYTLVAPRSHLRQVTGDFSPEEFAALQRVVYTIGEAIRQAVPTERLYVLSLGSEQGNAHVHWHLVPLPPGVPIEKQQYALLDRNEYLSFSDVETERLAGLIEKEIKKSTR